MKTEWVPHGTAFEEVVVVAASCPHESSVYPLSLARAPTTAAAVRPQNSLAVVASRKSTFNGEEI